jgi:hypothetical protein
MNMSVFGSVSVKFLKFQRLILICTESSSILKVWALIRWEMALRYTAFQEILLVRNLVLAILALDGRRAKARVCITIRGCWRHFLWSDCVRTYLSVKSPSSILWFLDLFIHLLDLRRIIFAIYLPLFLNDWLT